MKRVIINGLATFVYVLSIIAGVCYLYLFSASLFASTGIEWSHLFSMLGFSALGGISAAIAHTYKNKKLEFSIKTKIKRAEFVITACILIWAVGAIYHVFFIRPIDLGFLFAFSIVFGFGTYFAVMLRNQLVAENQRYSFDEEASSVSNLGGFPIDAEDDDDQPMTGDEDDPNIDHDEIDRKVNNFTETIENVKRSMRTKETDSGIKLGFEGPPGYTDTLHSGQPGSSIDDLHYQNAVAFFSEPGSMVDWDDETCFILSQKLAHVQRFMDMSLYKGNDTQRAYYILNEVQRISEELDEFYIQLKTDILGPQDVDETLDELGDVEF